MKLRDVKGKCIVAVRHTRWWNEHLHQHEVTVDEIELNDGTRLVPFAFETVEGPAATVSAVKPKLKAVSQ